MRGDARRAACTGFPFAIKDVTLDGRHPHHVRLAALQGSRPRRGRRGGAPAQGRRRHRAGEDQHAGIRHRRQHRQRPVRRDAQSVESGAQPSRLLRAARRSRSRPAWFRSRREPISAARSAFRRRSAASSASGRRPASRRTIPMPLAWDPGQVHGPLARTAEDAALDARRHGRVEPALADLGRAAVAAARSRRWSAARTRAGCGSPMSPTSPGIGVDAEIDAICRQAARQLQDAGAAVDEIAFDVSDGRDPYQTWRGAWMVGQQFARLAQLEEFGDEPQGQRESGDAGHRARPRGGRADARSRCFTASANCSSATTSCSRRPRR